MEFSAAGCTELTLNGFAKLLEGCRKLRTIELWNCTQVTDVWIMLLIVWKMWLRDHTVPQECSLEQIDLTGCTKLSNKALAALAQTFPNLRIIHSKSCLEV